MSHEQHRRDELDREVRDRLTPQEINQLVRQLKGAIAAIDLLRERAPLVADAFFADMGILDTGDVSMQAHSALEALVDELRLARARQLDAPPVAMPSRDVLRLAYSERA